jgi:oligosaccharide repeat unit polymerase
MSLPGRRRVDDKCGLDMLSPRFVYPVATIIYFAVGTPNLVQNFVIDSPVSWRIWLPIAIGLLAFLFGTRLGSVSDGGRPRIRDESSHNRAVNATVAIFIVSASLSVYGFLIEGSPLLAGDAGEEMRLSYGQKVGGWISLTHLGLETVALVSFYLLMTRRKVRLARNRVLLLVFISSVALLFLTGIRTYLVFIAIGIMATFHYHFKRLKPMYVAIIATSLLLVVGSIGFARIWFLQAGDTWYQDEMVKLGINPMLAPLAPLYLSFRSGAENLAFLSTEIPRYHDYFRGELLWRTLSVFWVRHQQLSASYLMENVFGMDPAVFGPVGATTVGTFWAEGGYVGISLGFALIGILLETTYRRMLRSNTVFGQLCYVSCLGTCLIYIYGTFFGEINLIVRLVLLGLISFAARSTPRKTWSAQS